MSGRYVSRVLESGLAPDLKFTAAVFASFADEDGLCWPSIGHVAHLRGLEERRVQYHVKEFRRMELFEIVRPATQWHPTYYRIQLDKFPSRPPYKPPDRQQTFLDPVGESPGSDQPGVHSTAPLPGVHSTVPGVHSTAPGVQPSAPDPSVDPSVRSVSTHTYGARASAGAENATNAGGESEASETAVQPSAPLAGTSRLPLVVAPRRDPDHAAHAWCGRVCVAKFLHKQFKKALGGPVTKKPLRLRTFYAETLEAISTARDIGDDPVKFWRQAFAARFGSAAPEMPERLTQRELEDARRLRSNVYNGCPHDENHSYADCVRAIALRMKVG